jgi:Fe-S cluster biosynthesis and repair protein YggX
MTTQRTVFCKKLGADSPGLEQAPLKGPVGQLIYDNISEQAWLDWIEAQMKIINELRLDLSEEKAQSKLYEHMIEYLNLRSGE